MHADVVVTITEIGTDVLMEASGSFDLQGLTLDRPGQDTGSSGPHVYPIAGGFTVGDQTLTDMYDLDDLGYLPFDQANLTPFGTGGREYTIPFNGDVWTGDYFGLFMYTYSSSPTDILYDPKIMVPVGYVSGDALSGSLQIADESFGSLGIELGTYVNQLPNNTLTIRVIPAPSSIAAMTALGLIAVRRRKSKKC